MAKVQSSASNCPRCGETAKLRTRDFSSQALATLISWGDLNEKHVSEPICDNCYNEMRDALIENQTDQKPMGKVKKVS